MGEHKGKEAELHHKAAKDGDLLGGERKGRVMRENAVAGKEVGGDLAEALGKSGETMRGGGAGLELVQVGTAKDVGSKRAKGQHAETAPVAEAKEIERPQSADRDENNS